MVINGSLQFGYNQIAHWIRTMQDNKDSVFLKWENQLGTDYKQGQERIYKNPWPELTKIEIVSYSNKFHTTPYPTLIYLCVHLFSLSLSLSLSSCPFSFFLSIHLFRVISLKSQN